MIKVYTNVSYYSVPEAGELWFLGKHYSQMQDVYFGTIFGNEYTLFLRNAIINEICT